VIVFIGTAHSESNKQNHNGGNMPIFIGQEETRKIKRTLLRLWETYCVILIALILSDGITFPRLAGISAVSVWALHRLYKRYRRRCPGCLANKKSRTPHFLRGWLFKKSYYRIAPMKPNDNAFECHFENICVVCDCQWEIKPPIKKEFAHRPLALRYW